MSERERLRPSGPEGAYTNELSGASTDLVTSLAQRVGPVGARRAIQRRIAQRKARMEAESPVHDQEAAADGISGTGGSLPSLDVVQQSLGRHDIEDPAQVKAAAERATQSGGGQMPHHEQIQRSFGKHDISQIRAHTDEQARQGAKAMGAEAFASGDRVAFAQAPTLHTAAHEAAHVIQQRAGVVLKGGVGQAGDEHERHADAVADRVAQGKSAEDLLDQSTGHGGERQAVQRMLRRAPQVSVEPGKKPDKEEDETEEREPVKTPDTAAENAPRQEKAAEQLEKTYGRAASDYDFKAELKNAKSRSEMYRIIAAQVKDFADYAGKRYEYRGKYLFEQLKSLGDAYLPLLVDPGLMAPTYFDQFVTFVKKLEVKLGPWEAREAFSADVGTVDVYRALNVSESEQETIKEKGMMPQLLRTDHDDTPLDEVKDKSMFEVAQHRVMASRRTEGSKVPVPLNRPKDTDRPSLPERTRRVEEHKEKRAHAVAVRKSEEVTQSVATMPEVSASVAADPNQSGASNGRPLKIYTATLPKIDVISPADYYKRTPAPEGSKESDIAALKKKDEKFNNDFPQTGRLGKLGKGEFIPYDGKIESIVMGGIYPDELAAHKVREPQDWKVQPFQLDGLREEISLLAPKAQRNRRDIEKERAFLATHPEKKLEQLKRANDDPAEISELERSIEFAHATMDLEPATLEMERELARLLEKEKELVAQRNVRSADWA